jgi:hypothetical protein
VNPREQGDKGELSAATWFSEQGASVAFPLFHSPNWDLVVEREEGLYRVQVKTSTVFRNARWEVAICTRGGNRSWSGIVKRFSASRCDILFVHVGDGRRWCIPSERVDGGSAIHLGGLKYAEFEVDSGRPLRSPAPANATA